MRPSSATGRGEPRASGSVALGNILHDPGDKGRAAKGVGEEGGTKGKGVAAQHIEYVTSDSAGVKTRQGKAVRGALLGRLLEQTASSRAKIKTRK